jgi:GNAT superfamily N-acetyltransferase
MSQTIRPATADDARILRDLIVELASYEKLEHLVEATADDLRRHLFGPRPAAEALIAEVDGAAVGFALFFPNFSTFRGLPGIYLEDLFVKAEYRGRGLGKALLKRVATLAVERGCGRLEWAVLDWNAPSIAFYRSLGARPQDEWTLYRLDGEALRELGS